MKVKLTVDFFKDSKVAVVELRFKISQDFAIDSLLAD